MDPMRGRLIHLKERGFDPKCIVDVGAYRGEWADLASVLFPKADLYLFEANKQHEPILKNKGYDYSITLLGEEDGQVVNFYSSSSTEQQTGNSIFIENTNFYAEENLESEQMTAATLDRILSEKKAPTVDFIKLDVQGAELIVLDGAKETLKGVEAVLLEASILEYNKDAPTFEEIIRYMGDAEFRVYDVLGMHYLPAKLLSQMDILFIRKNSSLFPKGLLY